MTGNKEIKEIDTKNCTFYCFQDIVITNVLNAKNIKVNKKSYNAVFTYCIGYKTSNGVKPLHIIFNRINGHIEDNNRNKCLKLIPTSINKDEEIKKVLRNMK